MQPQLANPLEVPEDVRAEMDIEERRKNPGMLPRADRVPEEVRSELDHEARVADEQQLVSLQEGTQPSLEDETAE